MRTKHHLFVWLLIFVGLGLPSCGTEGGGGTTIVSKSFNVGAMVLGTLPRFVTPVSELKLCVGRIRLENESGEAQGGDSSGEIEFRPGLIDVSNGQEKTWGSLALPKGFVLKTIKIKVRKDSNLCPGDYSVRVNGVETQEEVELEWKLNPPQAFNEPATVRLGLQSFIDALLAHLGAGTLTPETLKTTLEQVEESFEVN